jgi:ABC-type branched-subunit amino acid transport system substrate-binding protein
VIKRRWSVLLVVLALLGAACSSDREDDEVSAGSEEATEETAADDGEGGDVAFGDLPSPCGEGDASGATDQGVTDDAIKIGYGDDAGFPNSPGLNHQMSDAVEAFIEWCNEQGGINGRSIEGTYYDAKITEVNNVMTKACANEFMLVGQGFSLDSGQEETRRACELPSVPGFAASPQHANGPLKYEPLPAPVNYVTITHGAALAELFPDAIKKAGALYANYAATIDNKEKVVAGFGEALGYDFICEVQYNIQGEADWRPLIQRLKDCGAEIVYWVGSPAPNFQNALTAAAQLEYEPVWFGDPNVYDDGFRKWNTEGFGDKVYFRSAFVPLFEADESKAVQDYVDIVEANGGDTALLGQQAASAFLLWATAAKACGSELTRDCVMDELSKVEDWTAGGFHAPGDVGANKAPDCGVTVKLEGTEFKRVEPEEVGEFACDPSYAFEITSGGVLDRAKLDADGISQL